MKKRRNAVGRTFCDAINIDLIIINAALGRL